MYFVWSSESMEWKPKVCWLLACQELLTTCVCFVATWIGWVARFMQSNWGYSLRFIPKKYLFFPFLFPWLEYVILKLWWLNLYMPLISSILVDNLMTYCSLRFILLMKINGCLQVHVHVKRHLMKELPETDEAVAQWCKDLFVEKVSIIHLVL